MIKHFSDIFFYKKNRSNILSEIDKIIKSDIYTNGKYVQKFEERFAEYNQKKYCVAVNSGTSALHLALLSCGVKKGDEVITTSLSFVASPFSISYTGAKPIFVDIDSKSWNINVKKIEEKITKKTKAIMPVHLHGLMCDMKEIHKLAKKYNLIVIEDASQAFGSLYNNTKAGNKSDVSTYSFFPTKNLGAYGEGGAILTNNLNIYKKCLELRNWGINFKFNQVSFNYRMVEISAAILIRKLRWINEGIEERINIADYYKKNLNLSEDSITRYEKKFSHSYHIFGILVKNRDKYLKNSKKYGIEFRSHYPYYLPNIKVYKKNNNIKYFLNSNRVSKKVLSLPIYPGLTKQEMKFVVNKLNQLI